MSVWSKIADVAKDVAPTLATAVGGPAAGGAAKILTSFFGGDSENPEEILANMQADPELRVKLEQIEKDHAADMRRLTIEAEKNRLAHDTEQTEQINQTMRAEYKNDIYWRRAVGWAFALTVVGFPLSIFISIWTDSIEVSQLPAIMAAMKEYWYIIGIVLGIGAHHAGKRERCQNGEKSSGGVANAIRAIRGEK